MTLLVCYNLGLTGSVLIADSRLSYLGTTGQVVSVRDVCQKIFAPNNWSVFGFAGDLCLGNDLAGAFFQRLRGTEWSDHLWLNDADTVRAFVLEVTAQHSRLGDAHQDCAELTTGVIVTWVDLIQFNKADGTLDHFEFGTKALAAVSDGEVTHQNLEPLVMGSGGVIKPHLTIERAINIAGQDDHVQQILMGLALTREMIERERVATVGGLFQAAALGRRGGVRLVPYFYWANVTRRFGTYVAMRIEDGRWVQQHRPSNRTVVVRRPFEILNQESDEGRWPIGKHEMFEPRSFLTNNSAGVYRPGALHLAYAEYDPLHVPPEVVASWGAEPPAPITWDTRPTPPSTEEPAAVGDPLPEENA